RSPRRAADRGRGAGGGGGGGPRLEHATRRDHRGGGPRRPQRVLLGRTGPPPRAAAGASRRGLTGRGGPRRTSTPGENWARGGPGERVNPAAATRFSSSASTVTASREEV